MRLEITYTLISRLVKMVVNKIHVEGYEEYKKAAEEQAKDGNDVFVLFCGSKNSAGESWCPDCVTAEPVIYSTLDELADSSTTLICCSVGDRIMWKDPNNVFRKNLSLKAVPTLIKHGSASERLVEHECMKKELVAMLIEG